MRGQDFEQILDDLRDDWKSFTIPGSALTALLVAYFIAGFLFGAILFGAQ